MKTSPGSVLLAATTLFLARIGLGGAIDVPQQDARASGQADAFSAQADDASAIFYNPAGLTQTRGTTASAGAALFLPRFEFDGAAGQNQEMRLPSVLPHVYVASDLGTERWRFGFGVNNPFGLNEDWGANGPLRFLVTNAHLYTFNFEPTVAYQVNDHLSVGVGVNVYYGDLELSRNVSLGAPPVPEGHFHFRGEDFAVGATPSLLWTIDDRNTVGFVYRSPFTMDFGGQARVKARGIPEIGPSHAYAKENFPQQATVAYAVRPVLPLKLEADVVWTDWNAVDKVQLHSADPHFNGTTVRDNWSSGFTYRLGAQYDLTREWALRAGYAYGRGAVPSATFSPLVPDSNYHLFSAGIGYARDNWSIDLAYQYIFREPRNIANSIYGGLVDGTWHNQFHVLAVTFGLKF